MGKKNIQIKTQEKKSVYFNFTKGFILYEPPDEVREKSYILISLPSAFDNVDDLKELKTAVEVAINFIENDIHS